MVGFCKREKREECWGEMERWTENAQRRWKVAWEEEVSFFDCREDIADEYAGGS